MISAHTKSVLLVSILIGASAPLFGCEEKRTYREVSLTVHGSLQCEGKCPSDLTLRLLEVSDRFAEKELATSKLIGDQNGFMLKSAYVTDSLKSKGASSEPAVFLEIASSQCPSFRKQIVTFDIDKYGKIHNAGVVAYACKQ